VCTLIDAVEKRMRWILIVVAGGGLLCPAVQAQSLADTCHASTSYDITVDVDSVRFDRAQPAPRQVAMHDGTLRVDGAAVTLGTEDGDRVAVFEQDVRALEPRVKAIAVQGVDLAAGAIREQARQTAPQAAASGELDARLDAQVRTIKARIAASHSTRDWQGAAFDRYVDQIAADIVPLLAGDLAQQALSLAISGDLAGAAALRDRAANLLGDTEARVRQRLQTLRPQLQALCPDIRRLDALESGIGARPGGARLDLIDIAG
jgi:hypothetical protein